MVVVSNRRASLVLLLLAGVLQGCEPFDPNPKEPFVDAEVARYTGLRNGLALDLSRNTALYYQGFNSGRFAMLDRLGEPEEDVYPVASSGQISFNRRLERLVDKALGERSWIFVDDTGEGMVVADTFGGGIARFDFRAFVPPPEPETPGEPVVEVDENGNVIEPPEPPELTGRFNCLEQDRLGQPEVRRFALELAGGTGAYTEQLAFGARRETLQMSAPELGLFDVSGLSHSQPRICIGGEPPGFSDEFFTSLVQSYGSSTEDYDVCWSVKGVGAISETGDKLFFAHIAIPEVEARSSRAVDSPIVLKTGLPGAIYDLVVPDESGVAGFKGYRPLRSYAVCLKESDLTNPASFSGEYGMVRNLRDTLVEDVVVSSLVPVDEDTVVELERARSSTDSLREVSFSYQVEADGRLFMGGREGYLSPTGDTILIDGTDPAAARSGIGLGIRSISDVDD